MSEQPEEVTVSLTNDKLQLTGISGSNPDHPVVFDYYPPLGDGKGYNGLALLLMSFAGCSGTAVIYLLRKMRKEVTGLKVNAKGIKRSTPPLKFEKIFLEFVVSSGNAGDGDMQKAVKLAEESLCPVWQMIKNNTEIIAEYKIIP